MANHDTTAFYLTVTDGAIIEKLIEFDGHLGNVAAFYNVSRSVLKGRIERTPTLSTAFADVRDSQNDDIEASLIDRGRRGNVLALIFLAKTRLGYREVLPTEDQPNDKQIGTSLSDWQVRREENKRKLLATMNDLNTIDGEAKVVEPATKR